MDDQSPKPPRKARSDSKLKNLPEEQQAKIYDWLCTPKDEETGYAA